MTKYKDDEGNNSLLEKGREQRLGMLAGSLVRGESWNDQSGEGARTGRRRRFLTAWSDSTESHRGRPPPPATVSSHHSC